MPRLSLRLLISASIIGAVLGIAYAPAIRAGVAGRGDIPFSAPDSTPRDRAVGGSSRVHCTGRTICVPILGIAVTLPMDWTATLTVYGLGAGPAATRPHAAPGRLLISLLGRADGCGDGEIVSRVATYWIRHSSPALHITQRPTVVAGAPALLITGLPGQGDFGVTLLVAHRGLLYGIYAFDSPRTALTAGQQAVLAHLQFIPRTGRFPPQLDKSVAKALRTCNSRIASVTPQ